jgi:hypothetical protein
MEYKLTEKCPETAYVQHIESGDFDYSEYDSLDEVIDVATSEWFPRVNDIKEIAEDGTEVKHTLETARAETAAHIQAYTQSEILEAANEDFSWPIKLGFVEEVGE